MVHAFDYVVLLLVFASHILLLEEEYEVVSNRQMKGRKV
jgi:hypothetical protein